MIRKRQIVAVLWLLALCGSVWAMEGNGTEADPYVITNVEELQAMQDDLGAYYMLGNDIDACDTRTWNGGAGFEPVGTEANSFVGTFDGEGHVIIGLYINRPSSHVGLFGCIYDNAEVNNVGLADVDVTGYWGGALVGRCEGSRVFRAWSSGTVSGTSSDQHPLGGLIGAVYYYSFVAQCYSSADVYATSGGSLANRTGGLAGLNSKGSIMIDCYAMGNVSGKTKVGGLVGDNTYRSWGGYIKRCYSVGKVTGSGGGLVGYNWQDGVTYDSYWDIQTSGKTSSAGGTGKTTVEMMQQATFANWDFIDVWDIVENESYPFLRCFVIVPLEVAVDIKPGSCPNPLNVVSRGVLPVAILGSEDFDVNTIDIASIRLTEVGPIRSSYEDVSAAVSDGKECECTTAGPDGHIDLTLKFETYKIVNAIGEVTDGDILPLTLTGALFNETLIEGADCIRVIGKFKPFNKADMNKDGMVNMVDFAILAENWLQFSVVQD